MGKLRVGLVVIAVLLVAVLAGYIGYARRKAKDFLHDLPRQLGMDITQSTDNFTYSQTLKGKTVFTVHASKEIQHKNGLITLKDVGILLYGANGDRADRIHGQEFEYDQEHGILRAVGEALIDLAPPSSGQAADEEHMIHVKTSGLVFRKDDGTAQTSEGVQFSTNGMVGQAVGAAYSSKTNVLILNSAVKLSGLRGAAGHERPVTLTAARAEMDRARNVLLLDAPSYTSTTDAGAQTVAAGSAVVHTGADGKPTAVEARGHVLLTGEGRGSIDAERMDVALNDEGQPRDGHLYGGVRYANQAPARQEQGQAQDVRVAFDDKGRARHALMTGVVQLDQAAGVSTRRLNAERVELTLSGGGKENAVLRGATASSAEGARLKLVESTPKGTTVTNVRGETLTGRFGTAGLTGLDGAGNTSLERLDTNTKGLAVAKETSTGDTLAIDLQPAGQTAKGKTRMELARAVQRGAVEIVREAAAKTAGGTPEIEHARGSAGNYEAASDQLTLTGDAAVSDATSTVFADKVLLDRGTGDAFAEGGVRVSYTQGNAGAEPVHVLAARAVAHKATGTTEFTAAAGAKVRMWQGSSQVEAPALTLDRTKKIVVAHGAADDDVRTTLSAQPARPGTRPQPPVRVLSRQMTYTDALRQVDFTGHVQVAEADGTLRAQDALVYLAPATAKTGAAEGLFGGKLERMVGTGAVELVQPGRTANGEKIVYTEADETYLLTGTKAVPPRLNDEQRGVVTGAELRFKRGDRSVEVVGGEGGRVRSEPRARQ